ncbi:MAG TPA: peptidylprolyl isomerase [Acidimicrobiales bacterium]|nr:peptidylprolyl isomerase [Acidimicrobiales bacterium]
MPTEKRARKRAAREAKFAELERQRKRRQGIRRAITFAVIIGIAVGIYFLVRSPSSKKSTASTTESATPTTATTTVDLANYTTSANCPASFTGKLVKPSWTHAPPLTINPDRKYTATVTTDVGSFTVDLDAKTAPQTVNSFVFLAENHFYDCVIFHRVIPGFMNQTGDPTGTGTGGPGYTIPDEFPKAASNPSKQFPLGGVAMANTGQPNSGGSQFFIVTGSEGESLPPKYTLFGQVTSGMSVIDKINQDGNANPSSNGVPPKVLHRMISIQINET